LGLSKLYALESVLKHPSNNIPPFGMSKIEDIGAQRDIEIERNG